MIDQETQKEINDLKGQINNLTGMFENFKLHTHTGFDSSMIKIQDLDTLYFQQATINPVSLVDGAGETIQITGIAGASLGDFVLVSAPYDLQDITVTPYIQANGIVEIRIQNESGSTVDLASGIWRVLIIKKIV